jgi:enamine deaminase RidA (YjgF/YER057c/UK114 family)
MSAVEDRLASKGLSLPEVAVPVAAYVPAVQSGTFVFTSGQLPTIAGQLIATETAAKCAEQCALNALAAIKSVIGDLDKVVRVVKVVGFVAGAPDFVAIPAVVNGASNLFALAFGDAGSHARSAVGVAALPLNAPVEVEVVVEVKN